MGNGKYHIVRVWIDPDLGTIDHSGKTVHSYTHTAYTEEGSASLINYGFSAKHAAQKTRADHQARCKQIYENAQHLEGEAREEYNPKKQVYFYLLNNGKAENGREFYDCMDIRLPDGISTAEKYQVLEEYQKTRDQ
jgi:hypothetical protein